MTEDSDGVRPLIRRSEITCELWCPARSGWRIREGPAGGQCGSGGCVCNPCALPRLASKSGFSTGNCAAALAMHRSVLYGGLVGALWREAPADSAEAPAGIDLSKLLPRSVRRIYPFTQCPKILLFALAVILVRNRV